MPRASVSHSVTTAATPEAVWLWYADVDRWPQWDGGVSGVALKGDFAAGARGRVTLPNGRRGRLRLLAVEPGIAYTDDVRVPLLRITTEHRLEPHGGGTTITHSVTVRGVLGRLFPRLTAVPIRKALPASVAQLAFLAARGH